MSDPKIEPREWLKEHGYVEIEGSGRHKVLAITEDGTFWISGARKYTIHDDVVTVL